MKCLTPISIKVKNERHNVPCNTCIYCLSNKRDQWSFRLGKELKQATTAYFITLTYDDENLIYGDTSPTLVKRDLQLFIKRLRQENTKMVQEYQDNSKERLDELKYKIRYYAVGEYGTKTLRPHYHGIFFNIHKGIKNQIENIWKKGRIHLGTVNGASIHYTTKYMITKGKQPKNVEPCFAIMSRKPAIGSNYLKNIKSTKIDHVIKDGYKMAMPKYYKDKTLKLTQHEKLQRKTEIQKKLDILEEKKRLRIEKKGTNYFKHKHDSDKNQIEIITKRTQKGKL